MGNLLLFTSVATNLLIFGLAASWYLIPLTERTSVVQAIIPLTLWRGLRTITQFNQ